ncbi:MAG: hypothetical protein H7Z75_22310 [Ferruginibacter sp.]|nr:hypothetical protein [Cytophagales bacterium]
MIFHNDNVLVLHALILGFVPAADAYSVDRRRGRPGSWLFGRSQAGAGWQYGWPIRLLGTVTVLAYFLAGMAKIAGPAGLAWTTGEVMRDQLAVDALRKIVLGSRASALINALYNESLLFVVAGAGTLVLELGAPFALANRRLGQLWALLALSMHWGIYLIMGITFRYQMSGAIFASFFPVERVLQRLVRPIGRSGPAATNGPTQTQAPTPAG